jgi:putative sterol carrier protein
VCPTDPGYEIGLLVTTDLRTFTCVWMGDISVRGALASGKLALEGSRAFRVAFERWIGLSDYVGVKAAKAA